MPFKGGDQCGSIRSVFSEKAGRQKILLFRFNKTFYKKNFKMEERIMKKFVCTVCGYVYEGEAAPEK